MLDLAKSAHVVSYFALKAGEKINVLKVVKLIHLADRECARQTGEPLLFGERVSMPHGPVNLDVYDAIQGAYGNPLWTDFLQGRENHDVGVLENIKEHDLDELSPFDIEILDSIWSKFGNMDQ